MSKNLKFDISNIIAADFDKIFKDFEVSFMDKQTKYIIKGANVYDKDEKRFYEIQVPGWKKEELKVTYDYLDKSLIIKGEKNNSEKDVDVWHKISFKKEMFIIQEKIESILDPETIKIDLLDGILTISIEKHKNIKQGVKQIKFE